MSGCQAQLSTFFTCDMLTAVKQVMTPSPCSCCFTWLLPARSIVVVVLEQPDAAVHCRMQQPEQRVEGRILRFAAQTDKHMVRCEPKVPPSSCNTIHAGPPGSHMFSRGVECSCCLLLGPCDASAAAAGRAAADSHKASPEQEGKDPSKADCTMVQLQLLFA